MCLGRLWRENELLPADHRVDYSAFMASEHEYDLLVIGSGPGGQKAAVAAAKLGKSVAVIEHRQMLGGVCVNTGTIPSKTLREAVVYLTGMNQRELYGASYRVKEKITPADLHERTAHVVKKKPTSSGTSWRATASTCSRGMGDSPMHTPWPSKVQTAPNTADRPASSSSSRWGSTWTTPA